MFQLRVAALVLVFGCSALRPLGAELRRPVAIAGSPNAAWLAVANRGTGTVSILDREQRRVLSELPVGTSLVDIEFFGDRHLLAVDHDQHQLVLLSREGPTWQVRHRLDVARHPVRLAVDAESRRCFVTSSWSRTVTLVDLADAEDKGLRTIAKRHLRFEPLHLGLDRPGGRLVVAGAFQADLALLDATELTLLSEHSLPGHNIRGMVLSGKSLMITQQELNAIGRSTRDDVHWGNVISNLLVTLPVAELASQPGELIHARQVTQLGEPGEAAGDPGCVLQDDELTIVLLSGVGEVAIGQPRSFQRVSVGKGPCDAVSLAGELFVVNRFSGTVSVVDLPAAQQVSEIELGASAAPNLVEVGEQLFFDSHLSLDGWMSCHSCHTDGHSNGQLNDNLSDGSFGAAKRVLSLLGVSDTEPWGWNGSVVSLADQVRNSISTTMQGPSPSDEQVRALVAYLESLPPPPVDPTSVETLVAAGRELFTELSCVECHRPPTYTSPRTYDVKLTDEVGSRDFNPPSLRGVGRRGKLFHDGRATSLRSVLSDHRHQLPRELSDEERKALVKFLESL